MTDEINVYLLDFPTTKGHEMIILNEDGSYTILINSRLDQKSAEKAYIHALSHIYNRDFEKLNVQDIEWSAHQ